MRRKRLTVVIFACVLVLTTFGVGAAYSTGNGDGLYWWGTTASNVGPLNGNHEKMLVTSLKKDSGKYIFTNWKWGSYDQRYRLYLTVKNSEGRIRGSNLHYGIGSMTSLGHDLLSENYYYSLYARREIWTDPTTNVTGNWTP